MKTMRKFMALLIATIMMASNIAPAFATDGGGALPQQASEDTTCPNVDGNNIDVTPVKPEGEETAESLTKNPDQPAIYTLRTDYLVERGVDEKGKPKYVVNYQPYIASVGEAATEEEIAKVNKKIKLPDLHGYYKPKDDSGREIDNYKITYDTVKNAADGKNKTGKKEDGFRYEGEQEFKYPGKPNDFKVKHVFQDLEDFTKYTNPNGSIGEEGALITSEKGNTGSKTIVKPLNKNTLDINTIVDPLDIKGFVPEQYKIEMQVPDNADDFVLEYRYNRAHFNVNFDTDGGTPIPSRTLYYGQEIPKIDKNILTEKTGSELQGWKSSVKLNKKDGSEIAAGKLIEAKDLDDGLLMPAEKVTFTAQWQDESKAGYAIQFWAEKADHADDALLLEKYDYIGTRVYENADAGFRPNLDKEPVNGIKFPDLDQNRLDKIWAGETFNRGRNKFLDKFYVYNRILTNSQNVDPNTGKRKSVSSTGQTVYNIYYDRQVYDLYFTKSNAQPAENTFYPEIWQYDESLGESVMMGGPGNPYHYKARFNEMMYKWPNDAKQTKGFTPGYQSFGWGPNYSVPGWPGYLDTPPYRLNADEFLDMENYTSWGGYTKHIDKGNNTTIDLDPLDFTTLSFGIKQDHPSIPHHMDFWMDGFKDGETIIRYDLVRTKADTASLTYGHRYPIVTGFTPYGYNPKAAWPAIQEGSEENGRVNEEEINDLNDERDEITPNTSGTYYNNNGIKLPIGQLDFIPVFYSDSDEFGDVKEGGQAFEQNGYLRFKYKRNKYPLRFNYDPTKIKDDSDFNSTNQLDTFYEFPLKALSPDVDENDEYKKVGTKEGPKNLLDNPENLQKLGLTDLVFNDPNDGNKLKVKRPKGLPDQMVFKGWALDPDGKKMVWENPGEKMPSHPVNLYAIWGEPDYKWKVTFDPDGGKLEDIKEANVTTERKKIKEGDIGQEEEKTYAKKENNEDNKQVFTVVQRQKLVEPKKPEKKGYDFLGWEVVHYTRDENGNYTNEQDNSYREKYKVPELYSFGTDVVGPIYLKAIWVPNQRVDVEVEHYFLDKNYNKDTSIKPNPLEEKLENVRAKYMASTTGDKQDADYILATPEELEKHKDSDIFDVYKYYNDRVKLNNSYFQTFRVEPEKIPDPNDSNKMIDNPDVKNNVFKFFYRPFRKREYKVNYIDIRYKGQLNEKEGAIIPQEEVVNGNRHFDARNYKSIPGWVLAKDEKPQQQLFFDVNEETNEFLGINGKNTDEITFYYKDVRIIRIPDGDTSETPKGYVKVTFKAVKNGELQENEVPKEVSYYVVKGLPFKNIPVPKIMKNGSKEEGVEIVPEKDYKFVGWEREDKTMGLLDGKQGVCKDYTFTAKFKKPKGKLTINKVLENKPVEKESIMTRMAVPEPLKFKFKVTGPEINGSKNKNPEQYTKEFELAAGKSITLENLFDGDYKVEEIEGNGYKPYYIEGEYDKDSSKLSADPIKVKLEKTDNEKDYEKTLTVVNKNVKPEKPGETNENIRDITVKKVWDGGKKPEVTIELWRKGYKAEYKEDATDKEKENALINEKVDEFTTGEGGEGKQSETFKDLPKHDPSGRVFTYYAMEVTKLKNYETIYSKDRLTITNKYIIPNTEKDIVGEKIWSGVSDEVVKPTVKLELRRKISEKDQGKKVVDAEDLGIDNKVNFGKQDKTDKNGVDYIYFVKEVDAEGKEFKHKNYSSEVDGLKVTNTYRDSTQPITATKIWKDDLGDSAKRPTIYFKLYRNIEGEKPQEVKGQELKKLPSGTTEVTWNNQDISDDAGNEYTYSVKEVNEKSENFTPDGYTKSEEGLTVTNTKNKEVPPTPETKPITVKATKIWSGGFEANYEAVDLKLIRINKKDSSEEDVTGRYEVEKTNNSKDKYSYIWKNLPSQDDEKNEYSYRVVEDGTIDGYYVKDDNKYLPIVEKDKVNSTDDVLIFKITNKYQAPQDPKNIVAYKKWVDVPKSETLPKIKFQLQRKIEGGDFADVDREVRDVIGQPDGDGFIEVSFGKQDEKDPDGKDYTYSVKEIGEDGTEFNSKDYKSEIINNLIVINTYIKETPEEPENPEEPEQPENPEVPEQPEYPDSPDVPEIPEEPEEQEIPEEPEEPETPEEPEITETPETPEKPVEKIPEKPEKEIPPVKIDKNKDQTGTKFVKKMEQTGTKIVSNVKNFLNPTTGIITNYEIYLGLMAASSVGLFFTREKKNKDDDED